MVVYYNPKKKIYNVEDQYLAKGGEGEIHNVQGDKKVVAKIFLPSLRVEAREKKILAMLASPPSPDAISQITWPTDILYDNGKFVGYIMPKLGQNEDLNVIYTKKYAHITWSKRILIASNLCVAINAVHEAGHICGDLNPKNILVDPSSGIITLVDTDSYHILDPASGRRYRCTVGLGEYLPKELHDKLHGGRSLEQLPDAFTKESDYFVLAIHIFALLMNGCHPYSCAIVPSAASVATPQPVENIKKGVFPFINNQNNTTIPVYAPPLSILPNEVVKLFSLAFLDGSKNPGKRPSPVEWHKALSGFDKNLKTCKTDPTHEYLKQLSSCPWCELKQRSQKALSSISSSKQSARPQLQQTTYTLPKSVYAVPTPSPTPKTQPTAAPSQPATPKKKKKKKGKWLFFLALCAALFFGYKYYPEYYFAAINGITSMFSQDEEPIVEFDPSPGVELPDAYIDNMEIISSPSYFYTNRWDASSYKKPFYIADQEYATGIGMYLRSAKLAADEVGQAVVELALPEGYSSLCFDIGPDSKWQNSEANGEFCLEIYDASSGECIFTTNWQDYSYASSVEIDIRFISNIDLVLYEVKGKSGTLNIVLGDFRLVDWT